MRTWLSVARYHLLQRLNYLVLPWAVLAFAFAVNLAIFASLLATGAGTGGSRYYTGSVATIFIFWFIAGLLTTTRSLPFGLALGVTRRTYYLGSVGLGTALAVAYGLGLTLLQVIERASSGWGLNMHFFRVPYILDGPWYLTWLSAFVGLALLYCYAMWFGLVYRRWDLLGLLSFIAVQVVVIGAGALAATWSHGWHSIDHFFTTISAAGLTGVLAGITAALVVGGLSTVRRLTV